MKDWTTISLAEYYKIKDIISEPDEYTTFNLLDILYGIDSSSLTISEITKYANALDFLHNDVPEVKLQKTYTLNGREYESNTNLSLVTIGQFVDYQNYIKESRFEDILSVFFVPVGHKYNDGYDIKQVKEDLLSLDFATIHSLAFFFSKQSELFFAIFQYSLIRMVMLMRMPKEKKQELLTQLNKEDFSNLVSSPISSLMRRKQILALRKHLRNLVTSYSMS